MGLAYNLIVGALFAGSATSAAQPAQAGGLLGALVQPARPAAEASVFASCDGYGAPTRKGDGITTGTFLFGLAASREDIRQGEIKAFAQKGVEACDAALADPLLQPQFAVRRANLLQAKAYHQIAAMDYDGALLTLDAVDAMRPALDPALFDRGQGLGDRLLRAYVYAEVGRKAEALALLDTIDKERAYAASVRRTTEQLRYMLDQDLGHQLERLRVMAPVVPSAAIMGFLFALENARMDDAVAFGAGLSFERPEMKGRWQTEGDAAEAYRKVVVEAMYAGAYAYALTANGEAEKATQTLSAARAALARSMEPPSPPADGRPLSNRVQIDFELRTTFGGKATTELDLWDKIIALRGEAPELGLVNLAQRMSEIGAKGTPVVLDLVQQAGRSSGAEKSGVLADLRARSAKERRDEFLVDLFKFAQQLPRPETQGGQVMVKPAGDGYFLSDNGYSARQDDEDPTDWTIRFTHMLATGPTLEEQAMLAAAQTARKKGYDAILVTQQRMMTRTTHVSGLYVGSYDQNSGREAQLRVRMVNKAALPADLAGSEWRLLDVDRVTADLAGLPHR